MVPVVRVFRGLQGICVPHLVPVLAPSVTNLTALNARVHLELGDLQLAREHALLDAINVCEHAKNLFTKN